MKQLSDQVIKQRGIYFEAVPSITGQVIHSCTPPHCVQVQNDPQVGCNNINMLTEMAVRVKALIRARIHVSEFQ
jgi:hypothetical protein